MSMILCSLMAAHHYTLPNGNFVVQTHILSGNIDADASERELWCYKVLRVAMET